MCWTWWTCVTCPRGQYPEHLEEKENVPVHLLFLGRRSRMGWLEQYLGKPKASWWNHQSRALPLVQEFLEAIPGYSRKTQACSSKLLVPPHDSGQEVHLAE